MYILRIHNSVNTGDPVYTITDRAGNKVEYGDWDAAYLGEIIDGRAIVEIVHKVYDDSSYEIVRAYAAANKITFVDNCGLVF